MIIDKICILWLGDGLLNCKPNCAGILITLVVRPCTKNNPLISCRKVETVLGKSTFLYHFNIFLACIQFFHIQVPLVYHLRPLPKISGSGIIAHENLKNSNSRSFAHGSKYTSSCINTLDYFQGTGSSVTPLPQFQRTGSSKTPCTSGVSEDPVSNMFTSAVHEDFVRVYSSGGVFEDPVRRNSTGGVLWGSRVQKLH